jgi:hypothetical protein
VSQVQSCGTFGQGSVIRNTNRRVNYMIHFSG